ncbi:MAG: hypothetical protein H7Y38_02505, partial [Armatimonadetes bacterium]|nr:hypothetical protein [Armatimonadota bacterium]
EAFKRTGNYASVELDELIQSGVFTTFSEVSKGKYKEYQLPPGWQTRQENYKTSKPMPMIYDILKIKKSRWNEDGSWNY